MTQGIEIYYHPLCPFFAPPGNPIRWRRAEAEGKMNILFDKNAVVAEITPLYPIHTMSYLQMINRTNKNIMRLDIAGVQHANPNTFAEDGLNIRNQEGDPDETYKAPPYGLVILFPTIERYRKIHFDQYGQTDIATDPYSMIGFPVTSAQQARLIRMWYQNHRTGDSQSPSGQALDIAELMPDYGTWIKRLLLAPDQDYPDGDLFANFDFSGAQIGNSWGLQQPVGWQLEGYTHASDSNGTYIPQLITYNGQKVIHIRAGYWTSYHAPVEEGFWDFVGIYQKFKMTPAWKRSAENASRCRLDFTPLSTTVLESSSIDNLSVTLSQNYFWNKVYEANPSMDEGSWETDRNSGEAAWYDFEAYYLPNEYSGSKLRHTLLDPVDFTSATQYPGKFQYRFRQYGVESGILPTTTDWATGNITIPQDTPVILSPTLTSAGTSDSIGSVPVFQIGQIGGRGDAIKVQFDLSGYEHTLVIEILDAKFSNRKIHVGDYFHFEYLMDSISQDNGMMMDLQISDDGGDNPFWLSGVTNEIYATGAADKWVKRECDLTPWATKFIQKIVIRFASGYGSDAGKILSYFQGAQILNNSERFLGKQFMITARVYSSNMANNNANGQYPDLFKPMIRFYLKKQDAFGNIYWFLLNMKFVGQYENKNGFYWIRGIAQIEADDNAIELGVGCGLDKRIPGHIVPGGYGTQDNGGYMMIERFSMEPMSKIHLATIYSTDNAQSPNDAIDDFHLLKPKNFGYKAWATQVYGKYFEEWTE